MVTTMRSIVTALVLFSWGGVVNAEDSATDPAMTMHHMHIMINHAVEMASEGSNLIMIGQMGMAKGIDESSIHHGKMMIDNAKSLLKEVMEGDAMMSLHKQGSTTTTSSDMAFTHDLAKSASAYIEMLSEMSASSMHHH